jgi:hypothetical protein
MSAAIDLAFARLELADLIVIKALKVSELAQMARIEVRLREFMHAKWAIRAKKAIERATKLVKQGESVEKVVDAIDKIMEPWANEVVPTYKQSIRDIYRLGREAGWKRATGQIKGDRALMFTTENYSQGETVIKAAPAPEAELLPSFDVFDQNAVKQLNKQNVFWVGKHYSANVAQSISETVRDTMVVTGLGREAAGELLRENLQKQFGKVTVPGGFNGSSKSYFEGLAANSATVARVAGQVRSFEQLDVATLEIVNPMDNRTSKQCQHMNGKVFTVEQARSQLDEEIGAKSPDDIKAIHPWLTMSQLEAISPKPGFAGKADIEELVKSKVVLPPYHFRCRTTVDVHSFTKGGPSGVTPTTPPKKLPKPKPKPKPKKPSEPVVPPAPPKLVPGTPESAKATKEAVKAMRKGAKIKNTNDARAYGEAVREAVEAEFVGVKTLKDIERIAKSLGVKPVFTMDMSGKLTAADIEIARITVARMTARQLAFPKLYQMPMGGRTGNNIHITLSSPARGGQSYDALASATKSWIRVNLDELAPEPIKAELFAQTLSKHNVFRHILHGPGRYEAVVGNVVDHELGHWVHHRLPTLAGKLNQLGKSWAAMPQVKATMLPQSARVRNILSDYATKRKSYDTVAAPRKELFAESIAGIWAGQAPKMADELPWLHKYFEQLLIAGSK